MKLIIGLVIGVLALNSINTAFAIIYKLPYQFGGSGSPDTMVQDALFSGTLISPPIMTMLVFAGLAALSTRQGWRGTLGLVGVALISVLFIR